MAEVAEDVWDRYDHEFGTDYSGLFRALSHVNYNIRVAAADALAAVLDEYPDTLQVITILVLFVFSSFVVLPLTKLLAHQETGKIGWVKLTLSFL